jgi:pectin methylesterase-like acyl-CoA thioesterase
MSHPDARPTRRNMIIAACATAACPFPVRASHAAEPGLSSVIKVDPSGRQSDVRTIAQALALAATRTSRDVPLRLVLEPGVYREKLTVTVPNIVIEGRGPSTVLTFGAAAGHKRPDGGGRWGTGGSATLTLAAPDITLRNLTIRNDFDYIADQTTHASGHVRSRGIRTRCTSPEARCSATAGSRA